MYQQHSKFLNVGLASTRTQTIHSQGSCMEQDPLPLLHLQWSESVVLIVLELTGCFRSDGQVLKQKALYPPAATNLLCPQDADNSQVVEKGALARKFSNTHKC